MKKTFYECPVEATIAAVGGKWKILILWRLGDRTRRYGELKRLLPEITEKMLISQLRELEQDGIISRTSFGEVPPRVDYALTPHGQALRPVLEAMCDWGQKHIQQNGLEAPHPVYVWPDPLSTHDENSSRAARVISSSTATAGESPSCSTALMAASTGVLTS